jgi:hypothetical protein
MHASYDGTSDAHGVIQCRAGMLAVARLLTVALLLEFTVPCEVTGGNTNQCSEGNLFIKRWKSQVFLIFFFVKTTI